MSDVVAPLSHEPRSRSASGIRPILHLLGMLFLASGGLMLFPLIVDLMLDGEGWHEFAFASAIAVSTGFVLVRLTKGTLASGLSLRQAFVLTPLSWFSVAVLGALPLFLGHFGLVSGSVTDAFFESISGLTTTGSTVLTNLDSAPAGLLLWRAILQWMGGIGIIGTAIAILPALGIGGMQLFRTESSDRSEKAMPRVRQIATAIFSVYLGLTVVAALTYFICGMTWFEAIAHALTTVSTGGYSTSDSSFGNWEANGIQWFATIFMLSGSIPFVLYVRFLAGDRRAIWDRQVKSFLAILAAVIVAITIWLAATGQYGFIAALRYSAFNVVSVVTTTGYATTDYSLWGNVAIAAFFGLTFVGGCTGSTAGGIKIFRFEVMALMLRAHFMKLLYPNGVFPRIYAGRPLTDQVVGSVVVFFAVFFVCYSGFTILLMALGLDFLTSASAAVTSLANVGPGLGDTIGPAGNFATMPVLAKWVLCFGMLLGRLELFTVLMLFVPAFWRK